MDMEILHWIQNLRSEPMDVIMRILSLISEFAAVWMVIALILLVTKKHKECAISMAYGGIASCLIGELAIKYIVARPRPFLLDTSIALVEGMHMPTSYSFPSGHTTQSFCAMVLLLCYFKKKAIPAVFLALGVAFSRMYLFVHYPTDVLAGAILGTVIAFTIFRIRKKCCLN